MRNLNLYSYSKEYHRKDAASWYRRNAQEKRDYMVKYRLRMRLVNAFNRVMKTQKAGDCE